MRGMWLRTTRRGSALGAKSWWKSLALLDGFSQNPSPQTAIFLPFAERHATDTRCVLLIWRSCL